MTQHLGVLEQFDDGGLMALYNAEIHACMNCGLALLGKIDSRTCASCRRVLCGKCCGHDVVDIIQRRTTCVCDHCLRTSSRIKLVQQQTSVSATGPGGSGGSGGSGISRGGNAAGYSGGGAARSGVGGGGPDDAVQSVRLPSLNLRRTRTPDPMTKADAISHIARIGRELLARSNSDEEEEEGVKGT